MSELAGVNRLHSVTGNIERIIHAVPGWTPLDELLVLHTLVFATASRGGDVLEIGSWCGRSTAVLGHAAAETGVGKVWAIDLFPGKNDWRTNSDGSHSLSVELAGKNISGYEEQTVWDEPYQRDIATVYARFDSTWDAFNATITAEKIEGVVSAFRGTGKMFAAQADPRLRVRMAFVDGDHSYGAVCDDIDAVEKFLVPGGWIAFDDAFSVYAGVDQAIRDRIISSGKYRFRHQPCRKLFIAQKATDEI